MSNSLAAQRRVRPVVTASLSMRRRVQGGQLMWVTGPGGALEPFDGDFASRIDLGAPTRMCRVCWRVLPECCFRPKTDHGSMVRFVPDCVICESLAREAWHAEHVFEDRAEDVLKHHMRVEREQGLHACPRLSAYQLQTGVTVEWLAEKMRAAYYGEGADGRCHHCETAGLPSEWQVACPIVLGVIDLSRMTVDRTDRKRLLARDNLTLMCLKGNIAKGETDETIYNKRQAYWRLHNAQKGAA